MTATLPKHSVRRTDGHPTVLAVVDAECWPVGSYAEVSARPCGGAFTARRVNGWTLDRIAAAVEAAKGRGEV